MKVIILILFWFLSLFSSASSQSFTLHHDHTNILVSDLEVSAQFYKQILQLKELDTPWGINPNVRFFSIGGSQQIHMVKVDKEDIVISRVTHMAFHVQNFDGYLNFLEEEGVLFSNFSGDKKDPQIRPDGVRQIYFQDPDGNWIEVNDARY